MKTSEFLRLPKCSKLELWLWWNYVEVLFFKITTGRVYNTSCSVAYKLFATKILRSLMVYLIRLVISCLILCWDCGEKIDKGIVLTFTLLQHKGNQKYPMTGIWNTKFDCPYHALNMPRMMLCLLLEASDVTGSTCRDVKEPFSNLENFCPFLRMLMMAFQDFSEILQRNTIHSIITYAYWHLPRQVCKNSRILKICSIVT